MAQLTPTSYAILGQLALGPWPAYELTREMRRNLHYFWPRAESGIYAEAKRLVELELASAETRSVGRRPRTIYSITPPGRHALAAWLADEPSGRTLLESEAILRVFLSNFGSPSDLLRSLDHLRDEALEMQRMARRIGHEYLEGKAPFQDLVEDRALIHDVLASYALTMAQFADRARRYVTRRSSLSAEGRQSQALRLVRQRTGELDDSLKHVPQRSASGAPPD